MQLPMLDCLTPAELRAAEIIVKCQSRAVSARVLGVSETTIRRLMQNARKRMARQMDARQRDYWLTPIGRPRNIRVGSLSDIANV